MATLPLVFLAAPDTDYLSKAEMVTWLGLADARSLNRLVRRGLVPAGRPRPEGGRAVWTREAAAVARWNLTHSDLYPPEVPATTGPEPEKGPDPE